MLEEATHLRSPGHPAQSWPEAFFPDPMMEWIFPDPETRLESVAAWLGLFAEGYLLSGRVDVFRFDEIQAVAMWRMPGDDVEFPKASVGIRFAGGIDRSDPRLSKSAAACATIGTLTPAQPFAYLHFLAVDVHHLARGLRSKVVSNRV